MKPKLIFASTALMMVALSGSVRADLAQDLTTMPVEQALAKAMENDDQSIEALISGATAKLQDQPDLLASLVVAAVAEFPDQMKPIVYIPACQVSEQNKESMVAALMTASAGNAALQGAIGQAAANCEQALAETEGTTEEAEQTEIEAEQTEVAVDTTVPPPPPPNTGAGDRPPEISPN
ncbi:hypothetical protein [Endozoicomonas sp. ALC020]|uniref:hypothetical protein n=1 Tax=unclassified Endozoicomonas TaxID=2644528 RepID=UPI003BB1D40F